MRRKVELVLLLLCLVALVAVTRNLETYITKNGETGSDTSEDQETVMSVSGSGETGKDVVGNGETGKDVSGSGETKRVVIDAGHGGDDPGKIGINNANEKDVNLQIAKKVKVLLEKQGIEVVMTREEDVMLAGEDENNKKIQDMKARVQLMNDSGADMVVSIHQNSYTDESIHGAQVFYYTHSTEGKALAEILQEALLEVDSDNTRQAKADDTYYILKRTKSPTVIVECGFLSNSQEADLLITESYQDQLAESIMKGIITCLSK